MSKKNAARFQPSIECLEDRTVPTVIGVSLSSAGRLEITGTDKAEELDVYEDSGKIVVYGGLRNNSIGISKLKEISVSSIKKGIYIDMKGGNDVVQMNFGKWGTKEVNPVSIGAEIHGGKDNDILIGGSGNDTIYGEAGVDQLSGFDGFDTYKDDYNPKSPVLDGYQYTDVNQEHSPTCQTLASIAESLRQGFDFSKMITATGKANEWSVKLPGTGKSWTVTFDGTWTSNDPDPVIDSKGMAEYWVLLLQRARLKSLGVSYTGPKTDKDWDNDQARTNNRLYDAADALATFTGRKVTYTDVTSSLSAKSIADSLARNDYVVLGSKKGATPKKVLTSSGVITNHAYAVLSVYQKNGKWYADLYNPWGTDVGSKGDNQKIGPSDSAGAKADDGVITLEWSVVVKNYLKVYTAKKA